MIKQIEKFLGRGVLDPIPKTENIPDERKPGSSSTSPLVAYQRKRKRLNKIAAASRKRNRA